MATLTRREMAKLFAGIAASRILRAEEPRLSVSGLDHLKVRVASAGAAAMFYYHLFGGDIIFVRNSTHPDSPLVDEFFLKIGQPAYPYLMLSQLGGGVLPGLDHLSLLAEANGRDVTDPDGAMIELMARPTWGLAVPAIRLPLPSNLRGLQPAFEPVALRRISLRTTDVDRSVRFYSEVLGLQNGQPAAAGRRAFTCGAVVLELGPLAGAQTPGLDRLGVGVRNASPQQARRILQQRGIQPYGSRSEVLFRDPDGNEVELVES
jgi:catechol 2,3-dioxygenase-like lactoylglutathione lyase family enzyme